MTRTDAVDAALTRWFTALASGDPAAMKGCFTPDARWVAPGRLPSSGTWVGPDRIVDDFFPIATGRMVPGSYSTELISTTTGEGRAVVEWSASARTVSGRSYENTYCAVFEVVDGRIAEVREHFDTQRGEVLFEQ